ncbi:MAG: ABC transporter ATP-binding protein [Alphaproteobacteria bacterium]
MSALILQDLVKSFGRISALKGVSFDVGEREFFCLLGPSAAGKTTTLRAVAGLEELDSGTITFHGDDQAGRPVQGRGMAMIFQSFALYPHMSAHDNLAYPLREEGVARAQLRQRVGEIAEMLRLSHVLARKPDTLSGGEQQRVAIGRALIRRPRLLLLDEPLTNLDAKLRHDTRAEFKRLHRELDMALLYATPDQLEALTMGDRIGVLREGKVIQVGTPDELYDGPTDRYVGALVGAPTMNFVAATNAGTGAVETGFGRLEAGPWSQALAAFGRGEQLLLGFRPHDIRPVANGGQTAAGLTVQAKLHLTEPLGDITVLDLRAGDAEFKMVLPEEKAVGYTVGDEFDVSIALERTHLFAATTGTAIR